MSCMEAERGYALAQLTSRITMRVRAVAGDDPLVKMDCLITYPINKLQAEAPPEANQTFYRDEGTSEATEKKENLKADDAKHSPKISCRDRILQCTMEQILDVPVPEKVEQLAEMPKIVSQDRIQERAVEQTVDIPVPQDVEETAEFFKTSSQDRVQQRFRGQIIELSLAEKIVEMPVTQMREETKQVVNTHVQHVVNAVEEEMPKIIKETVQRKKPIIK